MLEYTNAQTSQMPEVQLKVTEITNKDNFRDWLEIPHEPKESAIFNLIVST